MTINEHMTEYAGLPVFEFEGPADGLPEPGAVAWRLTHDEDEDGRFGLLFKDFLDAVDTERVTHLVVGCWSVTLSPADPYPPDLLIGAAHHFPALRSLFFGDIVLEQQEISWIEHDDITPLLEAFPALERLDVRGSAGLVLRPFRSEALRTLRFESGGLPSEIVRAVAASELPGLRHLDLWLGARAYDGDVGEADLAEILAGDRLPALRHLGLENAEIADEAAAALAGAAVVARLESLSLAKGILSDTGAEALLAGQPLTHLKRLDLHHHFVTEPMRDRLRAALPGVDIDLSEPHGSGHEPEWSYIYVAE
ncbi:STM4015 family protein [Spirillospora sp. NPDC029432]|uniref:STM4015 family protein n=1 Tax=Spirillospora sp. NPDC029432 TaxID=3154599 RepID=UPI00345230C1